MALLSSRSILISCVLAFMIIYALFSTDRLPAYPLFEHLPNSSPQTPSSPPSSDPSTPEQPVPESPSTESPSTEPPPSAQVVPAPSSPESGEEVPYPWLAEAERLPPPPAVVTTAIEDRPLIIFAYAESEFGRENVRFFLDHGLHAAADFLFILNGETDIEKLIFPEHPEIPIRDRSNIVIRKRDNKCFDLGAHYEVLNSVVGGEGWFNQAGQIPVPKNVKNDPVDIEKPKFGKNNEHLRLRHRYKQYILMNASIRGPFVPTWANVCWSDAYLSKLTDKNKLIGMSYNCHRGNGHVQSMIWATDSIGLSVLLAPEGIGECFSEMSLAMEAEIRTTNWLRSNGYDVDVFLSVYHSSDRKKKAKALAQSHGVKVDDKPIGYWVNCTHEDFLKPVQPVTNPEGFFGTFVHPYENLFMKSHRHIDDATLDRLTEWTDGMGYDSYEWCH